MKWPNTLTILRHGESEFNLLKKNRRAGEEYKKFRTLFEKEYRDINKINWPSDKIQKMAMELWQDNYFNFSDYKTPLTKEGHRQAKETGGNLKKIISLPDIIYFSPYLRAKETLESLVKGWPELAKAKAVPEERIREQEHGLQTVFNDWRIFCVLNPIQGLLLKREGDYFYRHPNGENKADVRDRVKDFMGTLIREESGKNVLLVSHHLTLLSFRANIERWLPEKFIEVDRSEKPINCGVTVYKGDSKLGRDGKLILNMYNKKLWIK